MSEYGTLIDYTTGEAIRPATEVEQKLSAERGETGAFTVDRDGEICADDADDAVFGPKRSVFVQS